MAAAKEITLQAKNLIINGSGSHKPGSVFKCSEKEANFLLKKNAVIKIGKNQGPISEDSFEKRSVVKLSKKEQEKADKIAKKNAAKFEEERKKAESDAALKIKQGQ